MKGHVMEIIQKKINFECAKQLLRIQVLKAVFRALAGICFVILAVYFSLFTPIIRNWSVAFATLSFLISFICLWPIGKLAWQAVNWLRENVMFRYKPLTLPMNLSADWRPHEKVTIPRFTTVQYSNGEEVSFPEPDLPEWLWHQRLGK